MTTDPCKAREPRVIDNALIQECIIHIYGKGEVGRLVRQEGIPLDELDEIRFEYMHILKIDHLWVLSSLTKLQMNNNVIQKIENLDTLVTLQELDLSFNKISKIENLDALVNLKKLTFYQNLIETIENMDNQKKLAVLSIGKNQIKDWNNIHYLRKFSNLSSLNLANNPCAEEPNFRIFIAAFLPKVAYYEYIRLGDFEREAGIEMFENELTKLEKVEEVENTKRAAIEKEIADAELHSVSFVEYLNTRHLFNAMFENDVEGKALLEVGDEVKEFYVEYEEQFLNYCKQVFNVGQKHYVIRKDEVDQFLKTVETAQKESQANSIEYMEEFMTRKIQIVHEVKILQDDLDQEHIEEQEYLEALSLFTEEFMGLIHETWKKLMKMELQLFEQVDEVNQNFGHTLNDLINSFLEEAQAIFALIRALEVTYAENVGDAAGRLLTNANLNEDTVIIPDALAEILADKEALNNAMGATHDVHMQAIDNREDTLVNRAKGWQESFTSGLINDEIKRNRYKLLEINHFLDIQKEEYRDLTSDKTIVLDEDMLVI